MKKMILLGSLLLNSLALAQSSAIGMVNSFTGQVTVTHENSKGMPVIQGMKLQVSDTVKTAEDSSVKLLMHDGNVFMLNENSSLKLSEYAAEHSGNTTLILNGDMHSQIKQKYKDEDFRVVMPSAVVGVRGTDFFLEQDQGNTRVTTFEGTVEIGSAMKGRKIESPVRVEKGFQVSSLGKSFSHANIKRVPDTELRQLRSNSQRVFHHGAFKTRREERRRRRERH